MPRSSSAATRPTWLESADGRQRANVALVADVADAVAALGEPDVPGKVRERLIAIIERAAETRQGVPVSIAARLLEVSEPTVRTWIDRGVLDVEAGSNPKAVTPRSLGEAVAAAAQIRHAGGDKRLLRRVLDEIDDQRTRRSLDDRLVEMDDRVLIDAGGVTEELFS